MNSIATYKMKAIEKKKLSAIVLAVFLLFLFKIWGYVFTRTVFESVLMVYVSYITVFLAFSYALVQNGFGKVNRMCLYWIPYLVLTMFGYLMVNTNFERFTWWFAPLAMLLLSSKIGFLKAVPGKLIVWSGIIAMIGVYIQFLFLSFYNSFISPLIHAEVVLSLEGVVGMRGFTHQQGATSIILIFGYMGLLYLKDEVLPERLKNKSIYWTLVALMLISIFLTGKRSISFLAVVIPIFVYLISSKRGKDRIARVLVIALFGFSFYQLVLPSLFESSDLYVIQRFATTVETARMGGDYTSEREYLWDLAMDAYRTHPLLGIGVGRYSTYTGAETDTHNAYLQTLCEQGIVGFVCYVIAIVLCLLHTIRIFDRVKVSRFKNYMKAAIAIELVYVLYAITGNVNIDVDVIMYFLAIAIVIQVEAIQKVKRI